MSVSFEVYDFDKNQGNWDAYTQKHSQQKSESGVLVEEYSRFVDVGPGVQAFVGMTVRHVQSQLAGQFGKIEFNPARVADPGGYGLATVDDSIGALIEAVAAAAAVVIPNRFDDLETYRLKRIDVAKDFRAVMDPSAVIRGLAPIKRRWARKNLVHADPSKNGAQTLMVGSNAGVARLYDKFAETKGAVEPGTLRWEVEARSDWSNKYGGLRTAADLRQVGIDRLARDRFEWSAMGVEVSSTAGVIDVIAQSELTERERMMFVGWLVHQSTPHAYGVSSRTLAKFRKLQRDLNVAVGPSAISSVGFSSRLDWESGREVVCVA